MPENTGETTQAETATTSATDTGADDLTALQAAMAELKLSPAQLKSRLADSRKWEDRAKARSDYDQIKDELEKARTANLSQAEKELEAARTEGRQTGAAEAALKYGTALVQAKFEGLISGRGVDAERAAVLSQHLSAGTYLAADGAIDDKALAAYVDAVAPKTDATRTGQWAPAAFGQGQRDTASEVPGAAGLAEAQRRFAKKS